MSVSVIIPAYNEETLLGGVLGPLMEIEEIAQIIVVSDGSTDNTVKVAEIYDAEIIMLPQNIGKGGALAVGIERAKEEIILFLDADLIGLQTKHIYQLISPVINGGVDMTVGVFTGGRLTTALAQVIAPNLSGQRCLKRSWSKQIPDLAKSGFGAEVALNRLAATENLVIKKVALSDLTHIMKEEKIGLWPGLIQRLKMYWEIVRISKRGVKNKRWSIN